MSLEYGIWLPGTAATEAEVSRRRSFYPSMLPMDIAVLARAAFVAYLLWCAS